MRLLYCDETNLEERAGDFLIYGGLVIDSDRVGALSREIDGIRRRRGVPQEYHLKFNPGPAAFSHQQFIDLKRDVLTSAHANGAKLLVYVILHDIAIDPDEARRNGINTVCFHFDCILNQVNDFGLVLIDRFNDAGNQIDAHLREKFMVGVTGLPYARVKRLGRIVGFHYSAVGQSHIPSIVDVALGSLRFAINSHTRGQAQNLATAGEMVALLGPMFWRLADDQPVPELGFMFSPKVIRAEAYRQQYQSLKAFLADRGLVTLQPITNQR